MTSRNPESSMLAKNLKTHVGNFDAIDLNGNNYSSVFEQDVWRCIGLTDESESNVEFAIASLIKIYICELEWGESKAFDHFVENIQIHENHEKKLMLEMKSHLAEQIKLMQSDGYLAAVCKEPNRPTKADIRNTHASFCSTASNLMEIDFRVIFTFRDNKNSLSHKTEDALFLAVIPNHGQSYFFGHYFSC